MDALKFTLKGKTAFFKKPDVNTYFYFTYGNIHKVAILGVLGAVLGLKGYNNQEKNNEYPEFYEKLKSVNIGIVPLNNKGYISKKIQIFNNSVGYASKEQGGNLIVKEQWLEDPKWDIYILLKGEIENQIKDNMLNYNFAFVPYLGKNDHMATIENIEVVKDINNINNPKKIDSLYIKDYFAFKNTEYNFDEEDKVEDTWKYEEMLPVLLEKNTNMYVLKSFVHTNSLIENSSYELIYECNNKNIFFF
ncbi:MAG: type I-B CRISPR-associated protein Cas5 [Clostridium argentinense]|uniref:Type I-B CRISPR-associated protein Cas5 n=1 Tax=Clostridium faecium TaxID=2762223 RepID=A0ABR8YMU6_9CLOT|nr:MULTISPECIES: type I-B CRISPR-associated protein Cas5b [Clostridium]MBD8045572.1 type I-B CRISPR-associated protein Cas5 [Clostridium faecium]MBS5824990.1 type I-B CRISPR-associated protein Cas5 [Clostridium argentinense]MDU1350314.1 type I-B CRISPR-associated protein Cas5b [Clostridium argentinense]